LDTTAWKAIIKKMLRWYGPFHFTLSGGEPLLRSDICELIAYAASAGCYASLITNGLLLTDRRIDSLINAGLEHLTISLNGINADTHNFTRGVHGAFEKIQKAVPALHNYNERLSISVATTIMGYNCHELAELVQWVSDQRFNGIKFQTLFFETGNRDYQKKWYDQSVLWYPKKGSYSDTIQELIDLKKNGAPILNSENQLNYFIKYFQNPDKLIDLDCKIGIHGFFVEPDGDAYLCYLFDPIGNLIQHAPEKIWNSKQAKTVRSQIKRCRLNCRLKNCNFTD
jgi:MoaA/NifB/PqqE/SkfB family radical SAM enzyme